MSADGGYRVLDACCGPRMMWFDREHSATVFVDRRIATVVQDRGPSSRGRKDAHIQPTVLADFTALPFRADSFDLVVFDPPHMLEIHHGMTGVVAQTYGALFAGWEEMLAEGFQECFRVLRANGTLIFKWCSIDIPLSRILELAPLPPLFGHRSGKKAQTHWLALMKTGQRHRA